MAEMPLIVPDNSKNSRIDAGEVSLNAGQRIVCEVLNDDGTVDHVVVDDNVPAGNSILLRVYYEGNLL